MPPRRLRLDQELVRRGLARSREHASELVAAGRVTVSGAPATKPATGVTTDVAIVVRDDPTSVDYVSRGGHKLAGALAAFEAHGLSVTGKRCLDAGASTGGFTDVLLRAGAREVVAVDVGYGQLAWSLQSDDRVQVHDRTVLIAGRGSCWATSARAPARERPPPTGVAEEHCLRAGAKRRRL